MSEKLKTLTAAKKLEDEKEVEVFCDRVYGATLSEHFADIFEKNFI